LRGAAARQRLDRQRCRHHRRAPRGAEGVRAPGRDEALDHAAVAWCVRRPGPGPSHLDAGVRRPRRTGALRHDRRARWPRTSHVEGLMRAHLPLRPALASTAMALVLALPLAATSATAPDDAREVKVERVRPSGAKLATLRYLKANRD